MRETGIEHNPFMRNEAFSMALMTAPTRSIQYGFWNELADEITVPTSLSHPA